jgi:hypothetical protein
VIDTSQVEALRPARIARARQEYQAILHQWQPDPSIEQCLRDLFHFTQQKQIQVVLVWMPEGPSFQRNYSTNSRRRIEQWLAQLTAAQQNTMLVDCRTWMTEDDFVDGHHLLPEAAIRWTRHLTKQVLLPWTTLHHR